MTKTVGEPEKVEPHEIAACYSLTAQHRRHVPCLMCTCGAQGVGETWEEAGLEFDVAHAKNRS